MSPSYYCHLNKSLDACLACMHFWYPLYKLSLWDPIRFSHECHVLPTSLPTYLPCMTTMALSFSAQQTGCYFKFFYKCHLNTLNFKAATTLMSPTACTTCMSGIYITDHAHCLPIAYFWSFPTSQSKSRILLFNLGIILDPLNLQWY